MWARTHLALLFKSLQTPVDLSSLLDWLTINMAFWWHYLDVAFKGVASRWMTLTDSLFTNAYHSGKTRELFYVKGE